MTGKRIVTRLILDAKGFRAGAELLDEASFRDRVLGLIASVPPLEPDGIRVLQVACNGCGAFEPVSAEDPQLPAGWITREDGEFCAACQ